MKEFFNLQLFAEGAEPDPSDQADQKNDEVKDAPKYTDADLDKIIDSKFAKWSAQKEKDLESARKEGEKLAKMNADQKKDYALEQANKRATDLEAKLAELTAIQEKAELRTAAAEIFAKEHQITASPEMLDFVVGKDAEETNANIKKMAALMQAERKAGEKQRATGTTPVSTSPFAADSDPFKKKLDKWR